jgi:alpha-tubulin suppressor-like RCC1 family protein
MVYQMEQKRGRVVAGALVSLLIDNQNRVYSFGRGQEGQLGHGDHKNRLVPTLIKDIKDQVPIMIADGINQSLLLDYRGQVWVFGRLIDRGNRSTLALIPTTINHGSFLGPSGPEEIQLCCIPLGPITGMATGKAHSLFLNSQGRVFSFGSNENGQLGLGDYADAFVPSLSEVILDSSIIIVKVVAGGESSLILSSKGQVFGFGDNTLGLLGLDTEEITVPTLIEKLENIIDLSTGGAHSLFLNSRGQVFACGYGLYGQLGLNSTEQHFTPILIECDEPMIAVSAGDEHSLILSVHGQVYSFGNNDSGVLGLGDKEDRLIPTLISGFADIIAISAGTNHSLICNSKGQVFSFGSNLHGQLGLGDQIKRVSPTFIEGITL